MRHIRLYYTGAAFFFLLFSATGAEPYSLFKILEGLQSEPQTYPSPLYSFSVCMKINNRVFSDALLNTTSQQYKRMYAEVAGVLDIAFNCSDCDTRETYRGVTNIQFSNGSVIANCTVQFQTIFINHVVIKHLFLRAIDNNNNTQMNGLAVNRQYTAETVKPAWIFPKTVPSAESSVGGLPGWAIALLVLACIIILLLFIIILLLCFWCCCRRKEKKEETQTVAPYERTSFKEHLANPTYMSHAPEKSPNYRNLGEPGAHGNQSGIYMMNPQR